jgi:hypothetical protein
MNDAFHRLKNRSRATVKPRDYSLTESENDSITKFSQDAITELEPPKAVAIPENYALTENTNDVMTKFSQDEITELIEPEPMVVRRTIRLEEEIDEALASICRAERITRDTFLEAAYLICSEQPELMELIITEARSRRKQRQQSGEKRKYETMKRKFTD